MKKTSSLRRAIGLAAAVAFSSGCVAHMMETHGDKIVLFNLGQVKPGRGGGIRYLSTGLPAFKKARKADAERQMRKFCSGDYTVTAEGPRSKFGAAMPIGGKVSFETDQYWYEAFECANES